MKVVSVINQKGGVGKTTSTYNIAALLATDNKVLIIDSDSQASLTLMMGIDPLSMTDNLSSIYDGKNINNCIYASNIENLDYIPSNLSLAKIETKLMTMMLGREYQLKYSVEAIKKEYDYILIDCPPTLGLLTINALVASDYVIAPCETTPLSVYALDDLEETIKAVKGTNPKLKFLGVIATKYVSNSLSHNTSLNELKERFNVIGIIKNSVSSQKGIDDGLPCVVADPKSIVAEEYREVINKLKEEL